MAERQNVNVDGAQLEASVEGDGAVTVVFENGLGTSLEEWDAVVPQVAACARVIRYNHRQAPPRGPLPQITVDTVLSDLDAVLRAVHARPPYVFVGHSLGGVIGRIFAHAHPADVAGLVFVDATNEAFDERALSILPAIYSVMLTLGHLPVVRRALFRRLCPAGASDAYRSRIETRLNDPERWPIGLRTARAETPAIAPALKRLRRDCPELPPVPVQVLTAGRMRSKSAVRVYERWKQMVAQAPHAEYRSISNAGHHLAIDAPSEVVGAIERVLDQLPTSRGSSST